MKEIKIEQEENDLVEEEFDQEGNGVKEDQSFRPRQIINEGSNQILEEIYNDETLKQIQRPPRAPVRKLFMGLAVGLVIGLIIGFFIAILFLRYF